MCKNARVPRGGGRSGEGTGGGEARALEIDGEKRARAGRAGRYHDEERLEPWMGAAAAAVLQRAVGRRAQLLVDGARAGMN